MQITSSIYESRLIQIYLLEIEIAAALWVHIFIFETTLRNFINTVLSKSKYGYLWPLFPGLLSRKEHKYLRPVFQRFKNRGLRANWITEEISLSFWIELCSARYHHKVWLLLESANPLLYEKRRDFYKKAREIRNLRNSIAHHGPIMRRNLIRDHEYLHELTATLDPDLADAVQKRSRVLDLLLNARLVGSGGGI